MSETESTTKSTSVEGELAELRAEVAALREWVENARPFVDREVAARAERLRKVERESRLLDLEFKRQRDEAMGGPGLLATNGDRQAWVAAATAQVAAGEAAIKQFP